MLRHGLSHILTFNSQDFIRYPDLTILTPEGVLHTGGDQVAPARDE
jgi:hypothetical protein